MISFFCPFPNQLCITVVSQIWGGGGNKEQKKRKPSVVFWLEKQTAASVRSCTIHKRKRCLCSHVLCARGTAGFSSNRVGTMLHTHQSSWRQPWAFLSVMKVGTINGGLSLARRCFAPPAWLSGSHSGQLAERWSDWWFRRAQQL